MSFLFIFVAVLLAIFWMALVLFFGHMMQYGFYLVTFPYSNYFWSGTAYLLGGILGFSLVLAAGIYGCVTYL